jgi:hypothetical protein
MTIDRAAIPIMITSRSRVISVFSVKVGYYCLIRIALAFR